MLSDWDVTDFSFERRLADLETLVEAAGLDRFAVMGMSGGAPVALAYAHRHPARVSRMVLYGGLSCHRSRSADTGPDEEEATEAAYTAMIRAGWQRKDSVFRRVFTTSFIPDATEEHMEWMDELQRTSTNTENAVRSRVARQQIDVTDLLPEIAAPTLVLHARGDRTAPGAGPMLASRIPDARLVMLDSHNHILPADEPAWPVFRDEVAAYPAEFQQTQQAKRRSSRLLSEGRTSDAAQLLRTTSASLRTAYAALPQHMAVELIKEADLVESLADKSRYDAGRAAKATSFDTSMKSRNRGRQTRGARLALRWVSRGADLGASTFVLEEWEVQRLIRVVPSELHDAVRVPDGSVRNEIFAKTVAAAIGDEHPAYSFFDGAASHGGFTVERS